METLKKSFAPFVDSVTRFKRHLTGDPFHIVRYQLMALYLLVSIFIFVLLGWFVSSVAFQPVYEMFGVPNNSPAEQAFQDYKQAQFERRAVLIVLLVIATYFLAEFATRPIRLNAQSQRHFIAVASHELRTPLTVMKNMAEVALRNPDTLSRERAIAIITSNLEETNRLSETVQYLLTFSTLKSQKKLQDLERINLSEQLQNTLQLFTEEVRRQEQHIKTDLASNAVVKGNRIALEGLLTNLVKNAVQHTPRNGTIHISVSREGAGSQLRISNSGPGIPKTDLPYIFEPFFRSPEARGTGFGLGLSIARQAAELHKAQIFVRSNEETGTTFTVLFPPAQLKGG